METIIKRDYYLNKLISRKNNGLIKIITGIRRCGKSYLLNTLFYNYLIENNVAEDHIIKFAFDSGRDLAKIGEDIFLLDKEKRKVDPRKFMNYIESRMNSQGQYYFLLDEIQNLENFEFVLNGYLYNSNIDVYVTGSNAKFLSRDIITEFSGRGDEIYLSPLNFSEFMSIYSKSKYEGLEEYMLYGGIPLVVLRDNKEEKMMLLKNLFNEIYLTDIIKRYHIRNKIELEDTLDILASSIGGLTNPDNIKNTFQTVQKSHITHNTVKKYIDSFEDAFLIKSATRYDIKGRNYIETPLKYYFTDIGLRNICLNFRQVEKDHILENIIYNELIVRGYNVDVGVVTISELNSNKNPVRKQLEVDFVCNLGYKRYYIQVTESLPNYAKIEQETKSLKKIDDSFKKIIITGDLIPLHYNDDGILIMNIYDFLLNPAALEQ